MDGSPCRFVTGILTKTWHCRRPRPDLPAAEEGRLVAAAAVGGDEARVGPPHGRHREQEEDETVKEKEMRTSLLPLPL